MKKTLILVAALVLALGAAGNAYVLQAVSSNESDASGLGTVTMSTPATYKANTLTPNTGTLSEVYITTDGSDRLGQLFLPEEPAVWNLVVTAADGYNYSSIKLRMWAANIASSDGTAIYELKEGSTVLWSGTMFAATGNASNPTATVIFPWTPQSGAKMDLTFGQQIIPEPGSLLALGTGLIGLIGFGIRRRK